MQFASRAAHPASAFLNAVALLAVTAALIAASSGNFFSMNCLARCACCSGQPSCWPAPGCC